MPVHYRVEAGVAVFELDNGDLNVMSMAMHESFYRHYLRFLQDDEVVVGVIVGRGKHFSAGDDLKEIRTEQWSLDNVRWDHLVCKTSRSKPMIAAINGYCLGAGFLYAMTLCDIRIAGRSACLGAPEIAYGFGGISGATRLGAVIPGVHAAYLVLTGEKIDAERAAAMFLVNEVVADEDCLARAMDVARAIAVHPLEAVKVELDCLHRSTELSRQDLYQYTHTQYWQSRKLLGDSVDTGQQALQTMKAAKSSD